jgi:hypothetical protein
MIILRQRIYAKRDYTTIDGKALPKDLKEKVVKRRAAWKDKLLKEREKINRSVDRGEPAIVSKFKRLFHPEYKYDPEKVRTEKYGRILEKVRNEEDYLRRDVKQTAYFRDPKHQRYEWG